MYVVHCTVYLLYMYYMYRPYTLVLGWATSSVLFAILCYGWEQSMPQLFYHWTFVLLR